MSSITEIATLAAKKIDKNIVYGRLEYQRVKDYTAIIEAAILEAFKLGQPAAPTP